MIVPPDQLPEQQPQNPLVAGLTPTHLLMALASQNGQESSTKRPRLPSPKKR